MSYYNSDLDAFPLYQQNDDVPPQPYPSHNRNRHYSSTPDLRRAGNRVIRRTARFDHSQQDYNLQDNPDEQHEGPIHFPHVKSKLSKMLPTQETLEHTALPFVGHALSGALATAVANLAVYPLEVVVKRLQVRKAVFGFEREMRRRRMGKSARMTLEERKDEEDRMLAYGTTSDDEGYGIVWKKKSTDSEEDDGLVYWSDSEVTGGNYGSARSKAADSLRRTLEKDRRKRASILDVNSSIGVARRRTNSTTESVRRAKGAGVVFDQSEPHVEESTYTTVTPDGRIVTTTTRTITEKIAGEDTQSQHKITKKEVGKVSDADDEEWYEEETRSKPRIDGEDDGYYTEGDEVEDIENYTGVIDAFHKIYEREGIRGFYTGVVEDTVHNIGHGFLHFTAHHLLRHHRLSKYPRGTKNLPMVEELSIGILASAITKFFTTPFSNIVTRKQTAIFQQQEERDIDKDRSEYNSSRRHRANDKKVSTRADGNSTSTKFRYDAKSHSYRRVPKELLHHKTHFSSHSHSHKDKKSKTKSEKITSLSILKEIYAERGITGLWAGYTPSLFMTVNPSLTFVIYEMLQDILPRVKGRKPTHAETFFISSVAKAMASAALYPLLVIKTRSQVMYKKRMEEVEKGFVEKGITQAGKGSSVSEQGSKKAIERFKQEYRSRYGGPKANLKDVILEIFETEGIKGFYVGLWAELLRGFISNWITVLIKESVFHSLTSLYLNFLRIKNGEENPVTNTFISIKKEVENTFGPTTTALKNKGSQVWKDAEWVVEQGKLKLESGKEYLVAGAKDFFGTGGGEAAEDMIKDQAYVSLGSVNKNNNGQFIQNRRSWAEEQVSHLRRTSSHDFRSTSPQHQHQHHHHHHHHHRDRLPPLPSAARDSPTPPPPPPIRRYTSSENINVTKTYSRPSPPPAPPIPPELPPIYETSQQRTIALEQHQSTSKDRVASWLAQQSKVDRYENPHTAAFTTTGEPVSSGSGSAAGALLARNVVAAGGAAGIANRIRARASMPSMQSSYYPEESSGVVKRVETTRRVSGLHPLVNGGRRLSPDAGVEFERGKGKGNGNGNGSDFTGTRNTALARAGSLGARKVSGGSGVREREFRLVKEEEKNVDLDVDVDWDEDVNFDFDIERERGSGKKYGYGYGNGGLFIENSRKVEYDDEDAIEKEGARGWGRVGYR